MARQPGLGRVELELLRYIADHQPITVREVADHLAETKGQTRTTALNMMERLRQKGYLVREKMEGIFHYAPRLPKQQILQDLVRDFVQQALGGSVQPFVAYMSAEGDLTAEELDELKRLVEKMEARDEGRP